MNTTTVSTTNAVTTTIYDTYTAPTISANGDATTTFTEGDTSKDLFDTVVITNPETTQTIDEIEFDVNNAVDGANDVINIDGVAIQMTAGTGTTASGYTYTVVDNGGDDYTITLDTTGASTSDIQTLVDNMSYTNTLVDTPTDGDRTIDIVSITDSGTSNNNTTYAAGVIRETVTVVAVNDDPVVGAPVLPLSYSAGMSLLGEGFTVADVDAGDGNDIQVVLSVDEGTFTASSIGNSSLTSLTPSAGNTVMTLVGTVTEIDNFLKGLTSGTLEFTNGSPTIDTTVTITANDLGNTGTGGGGNVSTTGLINTLANAAPVLDLDNNNSSTATGADYQATFTEGSAAVNIADTDTTLTDTESDDVTLMITAGNIQDGASEKLNFGSGQISLDGTNDAILNNVTVGVLNTVVDVFMTRLISITVMHKPLPSPIKMAIP